MKIQHKPVESHSVYFDFLGGKDVMPISGYYGPFEHTMHIDGYTMPENVNERLFKRMKECGINLITKTDDFYYKEKLTIKQLIGLDFVTRTDDEHGRSTESVIKSLELGEKYGIGYFVLDSLLMDYVYGGSHPVDASKVEERLKELYKYPAFVGLSVIDEPSADRFERIGEIQDWFYNYAKPNTHAYVNLYPTFASGKQLFGTLPPNTYKEHVDMFIKKCKPRFLSYDHYVFDPGRTKKEYFENMSIIRKAAFDNKIPFWSMLQAGPAYGVSAFITNPKLTPFPSEAQTLWNINTTLAYGAKGITYYPLMQPLFSEERILSLDYHTDGIFGFDGNCTRWYYYAQKANEQILATDHILMNSANLGVIAFGDTVCTDTAGGPEVIAEKKFREFINVKGGEALVGCFDYMGSTVLYLVNYSTEDTTEYELDFSDDYSYEIIRSAQSFNMSGKTIKVKLKAGEAALIRLM